MPTHRASSRSAGCTSVPSFFERACKRAAALPASIEAVVQGADWRQKGTAPTICLVDMLQPSSDLEHPGAVRCGVRCESFVRVATAHLEDVAVHQALDDQPNALSGERLQKEDGVQCRATRGGCASHLQVASTGEDDAVVNDVISDQG
eukprot:7301490-Prymnesium_polylepis.2